MAARDAPRHSQSKASHRQSACLLRTSKVILGCGLERQLEIDCSAVCRANVEPRRAGEDRDAAVRCDVDAVIIASRSQTATCGFRVLFGDSRRASASVSN